MSQDEDVTCCTMEENYKGSVFVREPEWYGMYVWYGEGGKEGAKVKGARCKPSCVSKIVCHQTIFPCCIRQCWAVCSLARGGKEVHFHSAGRAGYVARARETEEQMGNRTNVKKAPGPCKVYLPSVVYSIDTALRFCLLSDLALSCPMKTHERGELLRAPATNTQRQAPPLDQDLTSG